MIAAKQLAQPDLGKDFHGTETLLVKPCCTEAIAGAGVTPSPLRSGPGRILCHLYCVHGWDCGACAQNHNSFGSRV